MARTARRRFIANAFIRIDRLIIEKVDLAHSVKSMAQLLFLPDAAHVDPLN